MGRLEVGGSVRGRCRGPQGRLDRCLQPPGFVATEDGRPVGLLTYAAVDGECEVVAILSTEESRGIGRALMNAVRDHALALDTIASGSQ